MITLKTLPDATSQEVYDQIVDHLRTQGDKAYSNGNCVYHSKEGTKCAAGCLIADDEYHEDFEECGWYYLVAMGIVPRNHTNLIKEFQKVHDNVDTEDWENSFKKLAISFNLEYKEPQQ